METKEDDTVKKLMNMLKEDLAKPCNQNIILSVAGMDFSSQTVFNVNEKLREMYFRLIEAFEYYMDDTKENIQFYALWTIGTYFHDKFYSYPYLFLNAMRGSGKSRLLKLISYLGSGRYTMSMTEAIMFRTEGLLCIDELESIGGKDKAALRELLNASYKKGMKIMRTIKKKAVDGEKYETEEFECYRPIAIANINGMDDVLGDRCIKRILEKSNNPIKTKINENFEFNPSLEYIKANLVQCSVCSVELKKKQELWNKYVDSVYRDTLYTNYTNYTNYTLTVQETAFFSKIDKTGIFGRNLELFLPLFIIAEMIGEDVLDSFLEIGKKMSEEKRDREANESVDVMLYEFVSKQDTNLERYRIKELFFHFKNYVEMDEDWFNIKWFGKALVRLNLILDKVRKSNGIEVILNVAKAKEKLKIFKSD